MVPTIIGRRALEPLYHVGPPAFSRKANLIEDPSPGLDAIPDTEWSDLVRVPARKLEREDQSWVPRVLSEWSNAALCRRGGLQAGPGVGTQSCFQGWQTRQFDLDGVGPIISVTSRGRSPPSTRRAAPVGTPQELKEVISF